MSKIKEKPVFKDPKVMDRVSRIPKEVMRRGIDESAERFRQSVRDVQGHGDTPENYASDKIEGTAGDAAAHTGHAIKNIAGKLKNRIKTKESYEQAHEDFRSSQADEASHQPGARPLRQPNTEKPDETATARQGVDRHTGSEHGRQFGQTPDAGYGKATFSRQDANAQAYQGGKQHAQHTTQLRRQTQRISREELQRVAVQRNSAKVVAKSPVKTASKGSVKTAQHNVKTARTTAKAAGRSIKTAERTAKVTAKATKQTARAAAKAARAAAKAAIQATKVTIKAAITAIKAIIAAVKGLVTAIAAGGWVAVVIILAIGIVAAILCSAFGIFYSNESADGKPMTEAITEIDAGFKSSISTKIAELSSEGYDAVQVIYRGDIDGDSMNVNNWSDVLSVYAVMLTTDQETGTDVVVVTPEKLDKLKTIFNDMNKVNYKTEVITTEETVKNDDGEEETVTTTTLNIYITYSCLSYLEAADLYGFTEDQREILDEMMSPAYFSYFASLLGVDIYGGVDLTEIISNLPAGTEGAEVVKAAITKLGAPYVWGAKGPNRFDCSGFVYWSINEVDPDLGSSMRTNAAGQAKWCYSHDRVVGRSELQPGDLVFWQNLGCPGCSRWNEVHHTGIYIGDGKVIEASSSKGRVIIRDLWESASYPIFMFGRPYSH